MKHKLVAASLTAVLLAMPIISFGQGWMVHDAAANWKLYAQIGHMIDQYREIRRQYELMEYQARGMRNMTRYRSPAAIWASFPTGNETQNNDEWAQTVNRGTGAVEGWLRRSNRLLDIQGTLARYDAAQRENRRRDIADIERRDGAGISAIDMIGNVRVNGPGMERVIRELERDSLSDNSDDQTEAAQLNKLNASAVLHAKQLNTANQLAVNANEIAVLEFKAQRDAAVKALQLDAAVKLDGRRRNEEVFGNASASIQGWRLPQW